MKKTVAIGAMLGILSAGTAMALPFNDRTPPITPGASSAGGELSVQQILDTYVNGPSGLTSGQSGYYNAANQSSAAVWTPSDGNTATSYLVSLFTGHSNGIFGVYSYADPSKAFNLIDRYNAPNATQASFSISNGNLITLDQYGQQVVRYQNFGNTFGFFWKDMQAQSTAYTEDSLNTDSINTNGGARALAYQLREGTKVKVDNTATPLGMINDDDWVLSFEDLPNGDFDYNDATFLVQDVAPVPEPGTMMMLGAGFLGLAIYSKRRKNA